MLLVLLIAGLQLLQSCSCHGPKGLSESDWILARDQAINCLDEQLSDPGNWPPAGWPAPNIPAAPPNGGYKIVDILGPKQVPAGWPPITPAATPAVSDAN